MKDAGDLVLRAQAGDREAFEALVGQYYAPVYGLLCKWTGNRQDAEDLTQETFLRAFRYLRSFRPDENFKNWIYRIALNLCSDHFASTRRVVLLELDHEIVDPAHPPGAYDDAIRRRQLLQRVYGILPELTPRERSVFVLKAMEGLENDEIARILKISETTVRRFYGLARRRILRHFEREGAGESSKE